MIWPFTLLRPRNAARELALIGAAKRRKARESQHEFQVRTALEMRERMGLPYPKYLEGKK